MKIGVYTVDLLLGRSFTIEQKNLFLRELVDRLDLGQYLVASVSGRHHDSDVAEITFVIFSKAEATIESVLKILKKRISVIAPSISLASQETVVF
ncbi:MAG: hypothetical protein JXR63_10790 [Spirochaetales bacterium]|nr:hypothetical protein [Spirochaetales bacterium]